jgi:hypothetical protein
MAAPCEQAEQQFFCHLTCFKNLSHGVIVDVEEFLEDSRGDEPMKDIKFVLHDGHHVRINQLHQRHLRRDAVRDAA